MKGVETLIECGSSLLCNGNPNSMQHELIGLWLVIGQSLVDNADQVLRNSFSAFNTPRRRKKRRFGLHLVKADYAHAACSVVSR